MKLKAEIRTQKGKASAKRLRYEGKIPAILYGHGEEPILLKVDEKNAKLMTETEHFTLDFGKAMDVIIKDIQWNPVNSKIMHIDFQHLHRGEAVKVKVPVMLEGTEIVAKQGGIVEHILSEIEIECLPKDIPTEIKVDVSELKIGSSIHLEELPPIEGKLITSPESTVVTVLAPKAAEEKPPVEEEIPSEEEVSEEGVSEKEISEKETSDEKKTK